MAVGSAEKVKDKAGLASGTVDWGVSEGLKNVRAGCKINPMSTGLSTEICANNRISFATELPLYFANKMK